MNSHKHALEELKETSRTYYIPISRMPNRQQEAFASDYLLIRSIHEIE
ncbi:MAG: phytoene/squalene synthase family protein, partial [Elainellaceae cyanobacterium]